jgi:glycosyltransferase involved in cell wall biosynthesis
VKDYVAKNGLPDLIHVHVPWKAGLIALWMKKKYGKAFVVTEHWGIYNRVVENNFYTMPKFVQQLIIRIFREAKSFFSVSRFLANGVETLSGKNAGAILPNVVDTTLFFHKAEKYSNFTFVHVSNMVPLKNVRSILDAFNQFLKNKTAGVQLILIGNRDDEFVCYAETLGLLNSRVFFRGEVSYREVAEEMQLCHCLLLNSNMENSPCVIGEALCCGLPVIATSVGGVPELIHSSNSRLISAGDTEALSEAMEDVFRNYELFNPKQISEEASKKFGYPALAEKFRDLYNSFS